MSVPNSVNMPLDKVWATEDYKHFVMVVGFASGMMDENASEEMKAAYKDAAIMCERFVKIYNHLK